MQPTLQNTVVFDEHSFEVRGLKIIQVSLLLWCSSDRCEDNDDKNRYGKNAVYILALAFSVA